MKIITLFEIPHSTNKIVIPHYIRNNKAENEMTGAENLFHTHTKNTKTEKLHSHY